MGRIEHTLLDGEFSVRPNRPKTIARKPTIPQKVTNVSIYDKGPAPESPAPGEGRRLQRDEFGRLQVSDVLGDIHLAAVSLQEHAEVP